MRTKIPAWPFLCSRLPNPAWAQPNRQVPVVVDNRGKVLAEGLGQLTHMALANINGVPVGLPVSEAGFVDEATLGLTPRFKVRP